MQKNSLLPLIALAALGALPSAPLLAQSTFPGGSQPTTQPSPSSSPAVYGATAGVAPGRENTAGKNASPTNPAGTVNTVLPPGSGGPGVGTAGTATTLPGTATTSRNDDPALRGTTGTTQGAGVGINPGRTAAGQPAVNPASTSGAGTTNPAAAQAADLGKPGPANVGTAGPTGQAKGSTTGTIQGTAAGVQPGYAPTNSALQPVGGQPAPGNRANGAAGPTPGPKETPGPNPSVHP